MDREDLWEVPSLSPIGDKNLPIKKNERLFKLINLNWTPPRSICDYHLKGLEIIIRGKILKQIACLTLS